METATATLISRHSTSGTVDIDKYRAQTLEARHALRNILRAAAVGAIASMHRCIAAMRAYRKRRVAYRELAALDARALHDIGVNGGEIEAIASGRFASDSSRCRKHVVVSPREAAPTGNWRERARPGIRRALSCCPASP